jgi:outer membrane receptor protein involved in Fe transport
MPSTSAVFAAEIEEIVVTARATEESVREIPVAITAVGEERLNQFGLESFEDLEAITPQLSVGRATSGNGAVIAIRGIGSSPSSIGIEQSVAVIIDGAYMPQGRVINEGLFDTSQVAVLKGPQALYFGKNATAGVVSVTTNNPGDELEIIARVNHEFESADTTYEGIISAPVNDKLGLRLAVQASQMDEGWITNSAESPDTYGTFDAFTGETNFFDNPIADKYLPQEEMFFARLTAAGDLSDQFSYNLKGSYAKNERVYGSVSELFDCSTLNGTAHTSQPVLPQPPGRQTPLFEPLPLAAVDCSFDGERGINNIPPGVAAKNELLDQFGGGTARDEFESTIITANLAWSFEAADVQLVMSYQDQTVQWVGDQDGGAVTSIFAAEENTFENFSAEARAVTRLNGSVNFVLGGYYQSWDRFFDQDVIFAFLPGSLFGGTPPPGWLSGVLGPQFTGPLEDPNDEFTAYNKISETDGETISVYAEFIWDIAENLELTAGARYLRETKDSFFIQPFVNPFVTGLFIPFIEDDLLTRAAADQTFKNLIPEVTLTWTPTDNVTIYAAYKEGFKTGGFSNSAILSNLSPPFVNGEICISPRLGGTCTAGPGDEIEFRDFVFDPEQNKGGEVGIKTSLFENSMLASFEVFYYKFRDLQVDFFNSQQFAFVTENAGGSETYGAELQVDWATPIEGLTLSGSLSYLESKFTDFQSFCFVGQTPAQGCGPLLPGQTETDLRQNVAGNTRPGAPKWSGFLAFNFERPVGNNLLFGLTGNVQYKSKTVLSANDPNATYGSYATVDGNIRVGTQDGKWQLALIGKNLTDKLAIRSAGNVPGTGGNTGTNEGFRGDLTGGAIRPLQIELELTYRY